MSALLAWRDRVEPPPESSLAPTRALTPADLPFAIELLRITVDRFYRRRDVAWRMWIGVWGLPAVLAFVIAGDGDFEFSLGARVVITLAVVVILGSVSYWAILTTWGTRRDHWLGIAWSTAIASVLPQPEFPPALKHVEAGSWKAGIDVWVPMTITVALYGLVVYLVWTTDTGTPPAPLPF